MKNSQNSKPNWKNGILKDLVYFQRGFDITKTEQIEGKIPVISSSGITSYHTRAKVNGPGVIIGRKGTLGSVFFSESNYWPHDTTLWSKELKNNDPRFVYYFLKTLRLENYNVGNANPTINRNHIHKLKIKIPENILQKNIAIILSNYDELIDINHKRIQLLEEAARLLYREWFVYFRFPGHQQVKFIDGIPEGWKKCQVKDIVNTITPRKKMKKSEYLEDGLFPCVDQSQEFISGYTNDKDYLINKSLPIVIFGDHTRIVKHVDFPFVSGADGTKLIISKNKNINSEHLYFILKNINLSNYFYARHFKFLRDQWIIIPSEKICIQFGKFSKDIMNQVGINRKQNQKLAQARDLLLPRLMSGKIDVSEFNKDSIPVESEV
jgi:type I restriction enzyme, S subunit